MQGFSLSEKEVTNKQQKKTRMNSVHSNGTRVRDINMNSYLFDIYTDR